MPLDLLCLDADDTLWHNMRFFDAAERAFFDLMSPFANEDVARATLERTETANLAAYGYGAKSFTLSTIETATQLCGDALDGAMVARMLAAGRDLLAHPVELLDGLGEHFAGIEIVSDKTAETFSRLFERHGVAAGRAGMAGDSLRSDILPMLAAGGWAAYIPPALIWSHERAEEPAHHPRFARLATIADLPTWLDVIDRADRTA